MNRKKLRQVTLVLVVALLPVGAFGFGYFSRNDEHNKQVTNTLTVDGSIEGSIVETSKVNIDGIVPGDTVSETIDIKPNATAKSLLRVKIEPSWTGGNSKQTFTTSNLEFVYTEGIIVSDKIKDDTNNYWFKANDGYLYYMNAVTKESDAMKLVEGVKFNGGSNDTDANKYQGKNLEIKVTMDMIQCKYAPYKTRGGVDSKSDLYEKLKSLCPNADDHDETK